MRYAKKLVAGTVISGTPPAAEVLKGESAGSVFLYQADDKWGGAWSQNAGDPKAGGSLELFDINGYGRNFDRFVGTEGVHDTVVLEDGRNALFLDDSFSPYGDQARLVSIDEIVCGTGGQIVDLTSGRFGMGDVKIVGGSGADVLMSSLGNDWINAADGNDYVWGGSGDDTVIGGRGSDRVSGATGDDVARGGAGDDAVYGGAGNDKAYGDSGNDQVFGNDGDDQAYGNDGDDRLSGDDGSDQLGGGKGNDVLSGGNDGDVMRGNTGNDTLDGGNGDDVLYGNEDNDNLSGGEGSDILNGGVGDDMLAGGAAGDEMRGDKGNDIMSGGDGFDRFAWKRSDVFDAATKASYVDVITDYSKGDSLDFSAIVSQGKDNDATHFVRIEDTKEGSLVEAAFTKGGEFHDVVMLEGVHGLDVAELQKAGWLMI